MKQDVTDDAADGVGGDEARDRFAGELDEVFVVHPGDQLITAAEAVDLERLVNGPSAEG